jgi:hypothetical protein
VLAGCESTTDPLTALDAGAPHDAEAVDAIAHDADAVDAGVVDAEAAIDAELVFDAERAIDADTTDAHLCPRDANDCPTSMPPTSAASEEHWAIGSCIETEYSHDLAPFASEIAQAFAAWRIECACLDVELPFEDEHADINVAGWIRVVPLDTQFDMHIALVYRFYDVATGETRAVTIAIDPELDVRTFLQVLIYELGRGFGFVGVEDVPSLMNWLTDFVEPTAYDFEMFYARYGVCGS